MQARNLAESIDEYQAILALLKEMLAIALFLADNEVFLKSILFLVYFTRDIVLRVGFVLQEVLVILFIVSSVGRTRSVQKKRIQTCWTMLLLTVR